MTRTYCGWRKFCTTLKPWKTSACLLVCLFGIRFGLFKTDCLGYRQLTSRVDGPKVGTSWPLHWSSHRVYSPGTRKVRQNLGHPGKTKDFPIKTGTGLPEKRRVFVGVEFPPPQCHPAKWRHREPQGSAPGHRSSSPEASPTSGPQGSKDSKRGNRLRNMWMRACVCVCVCVCVFVVTPCFLWLQKKKSEENRSLLLVCWCSR